MIIHGRTTGERRTVLSSVSRKAWLLLALTATTTLFFKSYFINYGSSVGISKDAIEKNVAQKTASTAVPVHHDGSLPPINFNSAEAAPKDDETDVTNSSIPKEGSPQLTSSNKIEEVDKSNVGGVIVPPIQRISLVGERNSGTRWIYSHLSKCFGDQISVKNRLVRHKHWFQHDILPELREERTLVIAQFRDPFYWIEGMQRKPHHAPMHYKLPTWKVFLETPWTMPERPKFDREHIEQQRYSSKNDTSPFLYRCQDNFQPHQLISCLSRPFSSEEEYKSYMDYWRGDLPLPGFSGREPFYELQNDQSGKSYRNILAMRVAKIHNFLSLKDWDWIDDVHVIQYEKMISDGTDGLLSYIEEKTGLTRNCSAFEAQLDRVPNHLDYDMVEWINNNHDWEAESLIGYSQWKLE